MSDQGYMEIALSLAETAAALDEVPVGAVLVDRKGHIVATGFNLREHQQSCSAHAEMLALGKACKRMGSWRLPGCTLYVTLEPCLMCAGALLQSRIAKVCYATPDPKAGAMGSIYHVHNDPRLNHQVEVETGLLQKKASLLLKAFFRSKR